MKLAIMQPYFFPYIGYFQLINAVDTFLVYDDVNFIKQGWINRNRIVMNGSPLLFTLDLKGASSFKKICEIEIGSNTDKIQKTIEQAYKKAPFFADVYPIIQEILVLKENNLARFVTNSIVKISQFLKLKTKFEISSEKNITKDSQGQERIIEICKYFNAEKYINAIGGIELYSNSNFEKEGIRLFFLKSNEINYRQFNDKFIPSLSIIDMLMFNPVGIVSEFLRNYELI
jgi:hypothetical protein